MTQESSPTSLLKRNKKVLIIASVVLAIVLIVGFLISSFPSLLKTESSAREETNTADVEIIGTNFRAAPVEEHLAYVDVGLRNVGGAGTMILSATISDGTNQMTRNESIYFKKEQSMNFTFTFTEVSFSNFSEVHAYTWISTPETNSNKYTV
jgi:hypothetical protein